MAAKIKYEELLEKPIILFGSGRSGTTIISEILFQHEDLAWHSNYQEIFPGIPQINYLRRLFDNRLVEDGEVLEFCRGEQKYEAKAE